MNVPSLSEEEKAKIKEDYYKVLMEQSASYNEQKLRKILSPKQRQRLNQLVFQMEGPIALLYKSETCALLNLKEHQIEKIKKVVEYYAADLHSFYGRYGRQQINARRFDETRENRQQELQALAVVITAIEKDRDGDILLCLTEEQRTKWKIIQGRPLSISWASQLLSEEAFSDEK